MIRNFIFAGGVFWTILLVTAVGGRECTGKPPVIDSVLVVKYGGPVKATCYAQNKTEAMGWETPMGSKNEEHVQQLDLSINSTDWSLTSMMCFTISAEGQCSTEINITVYRIPASVTLLLNHTDPLHEGQQYELQCVVQSVAPAENLIINWYRGDTVLESLDFPQFTIDGDKSKDVTVTANLRITASREDHEVPYSCAASLNLNATEPIPDTKSNTIHLKVHYKPRVNISSPNLNLTEGEYLELNCTADANPSPTYQWRHNNKTLRTENKSTLLIGSVEMHHDGSYECVASNIQGQDSATITVVVWRNYLPVIAALVAAAIGVLFVVSIAIFCSYHKKNKTGAYFLTKFKAGKSQNGQVAHANGYP